MSFSTIQITAKGRALLAKAQTGTTINFTHIKMGDGAMTGQVIDDMTDVISQKANLSINAMKVLTGGKAKVQATFTNQGLSTGFYWREIAVFATDPDNVAAEIMYCYGNAGALADYIPAEGSQILERVISVLTIISNAANVTATIDSSNVYLTPQDADSSYVKKSIATAASQFLISSAVGTWVVKTIVEVKTLLGLGGAAYKEFNEVGGVASFDVVEAHQSDYVRQIGYGTTGGSANTYTLTLNPVLTAYTAGVGVTVKINVANTGASTINVNGLGAKAILDSKGNAMTAGKLRLNGIYTMRYDGTNFILQGEGGSGNAIASDLLLGKTASTDAGDIVGTMPNRAGDTAALASSVSGTTLKLIASNGYRDGVDDSVTITDADFVAANIVSGKDIFGVVGTNTNKRFQTVSATSSASGMIFRSEYNNFDVSWNGTGVVPYITVSGLSFTPSIILVYMGTMLIAQLNTAMLFNASYPVVYAHDVGYHCALVGNAYVTGGGFRLPVGNAGQSSALTCLCIE